MGDFFAKKGKGKGKTGKGNGEGRQISGFLRFGREGGVFLRGFECEIKGEWGVEKVK